MDMVSWWKTRLAHKLRELDEAQEVMFGSMVDKLRAMLYRTDLCHQIALLERNLARKEAEVATRQLQNLLAVIHRDGGHYTEACGLEKSTSDAVEVVCSLRTALAEAEIEIPKTPAVPTPSRVPRLGLACTNPCEADMVRASGDVICDSCQEPYRKHPYCRGHVTMMTGEPEYYLHVACDGRHLKL